MINFMLNDGRRKTIQLALFGFAFPMIRYATTFTDITNARVVIRSGLFGQNFDAVSLAEVQRVELLAGGIITLTVAGDGTIGGFGGGLPTKRFLLELEQRVGSR